MVGARYKNGNIKGFCIVTLLFSLYPNARTGNQARTICLMNPLYSLFWFWIILQKGFTWPSREIQFALNMRIGVYGSKGRSGPPKKAPYEALINICFLN